MITMRRIAAAGTVAVAATVMAGCSSIGSQIDALAQVSGVPVNTLQIATETVLEKNNIKVLISPACAQSQTDSTKFECPGGKTTTGESIDVTATNGPANTFTLAPGGTPTAYPAGTLDLVMNVKVAGKAIYEGQAQTVIDQSQGGVK